MKKLISLSLLATLLPATLFSFSGCMKKPETNQDFGPEVSLDQIQEAISSDAPMDLTRLKLGQYVSLDETQVINTQIPTTLSQRVDEITAYSETSTEVDLIFKVTLKELINGAWKESVQPFSLALEKANSAVSSAINLSAASLVKSMAMTATNSPAQVSIQSLKKQDAASEIRVTYHNLKRELNRIPVPEVVKAHPNCGGVTNCAAGLRTLQVSFDRVIWQSEEAPIKTAFKITYSPDIPAYIHDWDNTSDLYFTNQLQTCAQTWVEVSDGTNTQTVPVLQCLDVRDFKFGQ